MNASAQSRTIWLTLTLLLYLGACAERAAERGQLKQAPTGPVIEALIEALKARGAPEAQLKLGSYPLIHERSRAGAWIPLLSASCPHDLSPVETLNALTPALLQVGYELTPSDRTWRPGRPLLAGVSREGLPSLALRLYPAGPRLAVLLSPPLPEVVPPRVLRRLPEHLTFSLELNSPGAAGTYDYLSNAQRELSLSSSAASWRGRSLAPPPQAPDAPDLAARWREQLEALRSHPHLSALSLPPSALRYQALDQLKALAEELRGLRVTLVEPRGGGPERALAALRASGARVVQVSHELSADLNHNSAALKSVEAALVLEGEVVLSVPPLDQESWRLFTSWLAELTLHKGVNLMRLSELAR